MTIQNHNLNLMNFVARYRYLFQYASIVIKMIISKNMEVPFMELDINKAVGAAQDAVNGAIGKK